MPKKKNILFVIKRMDQGGPARSLLNLLYLIDYSKYSVTIQLFKSGGVLFNDLPSKARIIYAKPRGLFCSMKESWLNYSLWFPIKIVLRFIELIFKNNSISPVSLRWRLREKFIRKNPNKYDLGMAYMEGSPIYFLAKYIRSNVKIGRVPTDYESANLDKDFDYDYFKDMDKIFSITPGTAEILKRVFPELAHKIQVFELITSRSLIFSKAGEGMGFTDSFQGTRILTLSRYDDTKGTDLAIEASKILKDMQVNFKWYVVGNGNKSRYLKHVSNLGISSYFVFIEAIDNPFTLLKQADIYVQPSRYEGKSNAINEAKAMCKPIVITRFATSYEIINHLENGLIADLNPASIATNIKSLIDNPSMMSKYSKYWETNFQGNEMEANKIFDMIDTSAIG